MLIFQHERFDWVGKISTIRPVYHVKSSKFPTRVAAKGARGKDGRPQSWHSSSAHNILQTGVTGSGRDSGVADPIQTQLGDHATNILRIEKRRYV